MGTILPIIQANLRKGAGQAVSLLAFALIAALLLNLGLLLMLGFSSFFDQRSESLHAPHYALVEEKRLYSPTQMDYLKRYTGVTEVEKESVTSFSANIDYGGGKLPSYFIFLDVNGRRAMNDLTLIEGAAPTKDNDICLPYTFRAGGGYQLDDTFVMTTGDRVFRFTICGFTEDILFGSINNQMYQVYVSTSGYSVLADRMPDAECVILRARMENPKDSTILFYDCVKEFFYQTSIPEVDSAYVLSTGWNYAKTSRTMMSGITAIVLTMFAALIVLVSLLVIRFRIRNSIEESMTNIGALKAVGYTGSQLLWATVAQFTVMALVGAVVGIGISYALLPLVSGILELQTALQWKQGFDAFCSTLTFVSILLTVLTVTWLSTRRIRKLQPLTALRQGLSTHSFAKNHFPLDRTRGALPWLLAIKSALQTKGQMVMIFLIVMAVSMAASTGISIYGNLGLHPDSFAKLVAGEVPDAAFILNNHEDMGDLRAYVEDSGKARKLFYYQDLTVMINDYTIDNLVAEDFGLFEGTLLYEGRYPKHPNEICIGGSVVDVLNKRVGDTVRVKQGGRAEEYLVVGLIQMANNNGMVSAMTISGVLRIQPDYRPRGLHVYLTDNSKTSDFVNVVEQEFKGKLLYSVSLSELMNAQLSMYGDIFFAEAVVLLAVTVVVIFMVLYLMLKTLILRQRRTLGIQKALGFTTFQLMNQFAFYYLPVIACGVGAGGLLGALCFNPLFVTFTQSMGIMTASMPPSLELTVIMCVGLVLLAYVFALLIAWRIRRISAYALVSE